MSEQNPHNPFTPVPIHASGVRPLTFMGGERTPVLAGLFFYFSALSRMDWRARWCRPMDGVAGDDARDDKSRSADVANIAASPELSGILSGARPVECAGPRL